MSVSGNGNNLVGPETNHRNIKLNWLFLVSLNIYHYHACPHKIILLVNITDYQGNTSLHVLCGDKANADSAPDCISVLVCPYFPLLHTPINKHPHDYYAGQQRSKT